MYIVPFTISSMEMNMTVTILKRLERVAYAKNGNVHNPKHYFRWDLYVDGRLYLPSLPTKREAVSEAAQVLAHGAEWK